MWNEFMTMSEVRRRQQKDALMSQRALASDIQRKADILLKQLEEKNSITIESIETVEKDIFDLDSSVRWLMRVLLREEIANGRK